MLAGFVSLAAGLGIFSIIVALLHGAVFAVARLLQFSYFGILGPRGMFMLPFLAFVLLPLFSAVGLWVWEWQATQPIARYSLITSLALLQAPVLLWYFRAMERDAEKRVN